MIGYGMVQLASLLCEAERCRMGFHSVLLRALESIPKVLLLGLFTMKTKVYCPLPDDACPTTFHDKDQSLLPGL